MDRPTTLAVASLVFLAWWSAAAAFSTIGTYPPGNDAPRLLHSVSFWNKGSARIRDRKGKGLALGLLLRVPECVAEARVSRGWVSGPGGE